MTEPEIARYEVSTLGERTVASPLHLSTTHGDELPNYVPDGTRVLHEVELAPNAPNTTAAEQKAHALEKAGPRQLIYFDPKKTRAGIVTSGGLCPGINNVIRSIVLELVHKYGVSAPVLGFRYGYAGLDPGSDAAEVAAAADASPPSQIPSAPISLGLNEVRHIHTLGGTILGTSRGAHRPEVMVETLIAHGIDLLFVIGGDGTMRGAHAIAEETKRRGAKIAIVGIPKTIDNDIAFVDKTFGFETAVSMARVAIDAAHTEAISARGGIGLVKLMGREAGFIAAHATVASHDVNVCLVPEVSFRLDGPEGLLAHLERRLRARGHAVVVVAEGCGKDLLKHAHPDAHAHAQEKDQPERDASGNISFSAAEADIGTHLRKAIRNHFEARKLPCVLKYIDPSYMLRGVPANAIDAIFCDELARNAVHAAMAGKTDLMIGRLHRVFSHVPLDLVLTEKKQINPEKELWLAVTETTGQPRFI